MRFLTAVVLIIIIVIVVARLQWKYSIKEHDKAAIAEAGRDPFITGPRQTLSGWMERIRDGSQQRFLKCSECYGPIWDLWQYKGSNFKAIGIYLSETLSTDPTGPNYLTKDELLHLMNLTEEEITKLTTSYIPKGKYDVNGQRQ